MNRNAWQLFSNDVAFAEEALQQALDRQNSSPQQLANLCQYLTFFGHFQQAQALLLSSESAVLQEPHARAALMRVRQYRLHSNPWLSLCLNEQKPWLEGICQHITKASQPIQVHLGGGLGDMLETIATLHSNTSELQNRVQCVIPDWAKTALVPLIEQHQKDHQIDWIKQSEFAHSSGSQNSIELPMMVFKAALAQTKQQSDPEAVGQLVHNGLNTPTLLCCWRPKVDPDEKLWAHLRSLDMTTIVRLYRELMPLAQQRGIRVVDITRYRAHEAKELLNRHPSCLNLAAHTLRSFVDTTKHFGANTLVASIDTSLIHLTCWCGIKPVMLAHRWPDGRWLQGSWQNIDILEQDTLFDWEPPIQRLIQRVRDHAWT